MTNSLIPPFLPDGLKARFFHNRLWTMRRGTDRRGRGS
jgi:hypothetical protein